MIIILNEDKAVFAGHHVDLYPDHAVINATEYDDEGIPVDGETYLCFNESMELWETDFLPTPWVPNAYNFANGIFTLDQTSPAWQEYIAEKKKVLIQTGIVVTQKRLDDFAKTHSFDGILSACTYATSIIPKFKADGQYCVEARDMTWAKLYQIMGEVETGQRPIPEDFAEVEAELPPLEWPQ